MTGSQPTTKKATWRMGARELKRIQNIVILLICVLLFAAFRPYYVMLVERRDYQTCQSNVLAISRAITTYSADYDGTLPNAAGWMDAALTNTTARSNTGFRKEDLFRCPRDKSGSPSSYAFNDLVEGLSMEVTAKNPADEARRKSILRLDKTVMVIEKHGSPMNAHQMLKNWDAVADAISLPHDVGGLTGSAILAGGKPEGLNREQLDNARGKRF